MLSLSLLENNKNAILYEIPHGKPDPNQKCTLGDDTRDRVFQSAYKSNTCWYYNMNFIRMRICNDPCEELLKERENEKLCSQEEKPIQRMKILFRP